MAGEWGPLMIVFSAGYVAVFAIFLLLHLNAYRLREALERYDTLDNVRESGLNVAVGLVSIALAAGWSFYAGVVYWSLGPVMFVHGLYPSRARTRVLDAAEEGGPAIALG
jgi:hypothetical protein